MTEVDLWSHFAWNKITSCSELTQYMEVMNLSLHAWFGGRDIIPG